MFSFLISVVVRKVGPEVGFCALCLGRKHLFSLSSRAGRETRKAPEARNHIFIGLTGGDLRRPTQQNWEGREACLWQFGYYGGRGEIAGLRGLSRIQGWSKSIFAEGSRSFLSCPAPSPPPQASGTQRDLANLSAAHKSLHYSVCVRVCVCVCVGMGVCVCGGGGRLPLSYWQCSFRFSTGR